jgi:gluconate 2-dehydrogenase gamma chain
MTREPSSTPPRDDSAHEPGASAPSLSSSEATEDTDTLSRRLFVQRVAMVGTGAVVLSSCKDKEKPPAPKPPAPKGALTTSHLTFTDDEFAILTAAVETMLPKDEDPGATEAGVPTYIDRILQTPQLAQMKDNFPGGLAALSRRCERMHQVGFAQATPAQRAEVLGLFKDSPEKSGESRWYEMLVVLTLEGFLGDPSYGGNQGEVGWKLVGFQLVGRNPKGDPAKGYDGKKTLHDLRCGGGKGC